MKPQAPPRRGHPDTLTFSPLAWLKLLWFCHSGPTEVGGFGISGKNNLLYIEDFVTVKQQVTPASVRFDDEAVAELFDRLVDQGLHPHQFARLWIHTHPGASPLPSAVDEDTFARIFGKCDWAVMFIVSRTNRTYARLSFSAGPGGQLALPVDVHWPKWPEALAPGKSLDHLIEQWQADYAAHVNLLPEFVDVPWQGSDQQWWDGEPWSPELDAGFYEPTLQGAVHEFPF